jgi:hypothetical protein
MNLVDTRMIGAMTGSAVVAALVTATVYQGHIRATSGGQTVQIEPGATVELRAAQPPQPPAHADEPRAVGGAADALALQARLAATDKQVAELTARLTVGDDPRATAALPMVPPPALDKLRISGERQIVPDDLTREAIEMAGNRSLVGVFRLCVDVHGAISSVSLIKSTRFDRYDQTILRGIRDWKYRPFLVDGKPAPVCTEVTYLYTNDGDPPGHPTKPCDNVNLDDELTQAANQYSNGLASSALTIMQGALTCRQDARMYRFAALYACAAHDAPAAREMFAKLPAAMQPAIEQRCQQEAIDVRGREP